jgi:hypothetical protein
MYKLLHQSYFENKLKKKGAKMKNRFLSLTALGFFLAAFFLAVSPARAQKEVDEEIQALKNKLSQLEQQQIEFKKEATAAAAALPTFSYRPGNGMMIEAADKSWAFRTSLEAHFRMLFESGQDAIGRTNGEVMGRRFRPYFFYCLDNCLWEFEVALDLDGFGTGNAKNSTNTGGSSILQRGALHIHAENLNPFLPTITTGMDISTTGAPAVSRQGSSITGAQREYDILSRHTVNTGRAGQGLDFRWNDRSLSGIGIPGRISRFEFATATIGEGDDGLSSFKDRRSYDTYLGVQPWSQTKNKWLRGLLFEYGAWFCDIDPRGEQPNAANNVENGCDRVRLRDHGDAARQTIFDTGSRSIGGGLYTYMGPGITWQVGPYRLRTMGGFVQAADKGGTTGKKRAHNFLIGHDLFLWSPKGWLTGSANTRGSILVGTHFERNDASCETAARCASINGGQFHRETLLLREWDLWYFLAPRMSIGVSVLWYNASNVRTGANQAGENLGCFARGSAGTRGASCSWTDASITYRAEF